MKKYLVQNLFNNWSVFRVIRLVLAGAVLIQSIQMHDLLFGFLGGIFGLQVLLNAGCCGVSGCATNGGKVL